MQFRIVRLVLIREPLQEPVHIPVSLHRRKSLDVMSPVAPRNGLTEQKLVLLNPDQDADAIGQIKAYGYLIIPNRSNEYNSLYNIQLVLRQRNWKYF